MLPTDVCLTNTDAFGGSGNCDLAGSRHLQSERGQWREYEAPAQQPSSVQYFLVVGAAVIDAAIISAAQRTRVVARTQSVGVPSALQKSMC